MFGRVAKIPISITFNELAEMDFAGYGDSATFLHIRVKFSRFSAIVFFRNEEERRTNGGNGKRLRDFRLEGCFWDTRNYDGG